MFLDEMKKYPFDMLTAADVADVVGADPQTIREQAQKDVRQLGFKCVVVGNRLRIPRKAFINFMEE
jgi:hypothetical protein